MTPPIELPMAAPVATEPAAEPRVAESEEVRRFRVDGMDCAACAKTVQKSVAALDGVATAEVSFGTATMSCARSAAPAIAPSLPTGPPLWTRRRSGVAMPAPSRSPPRWRCWWSP
jgi:hypothetical protein